MRQRLIFKNNKKVSCWLRINTNWSQQSRAFNDTSKVDEYKIISLGSEVATGKAKIILYAIKQAT